MHTEVGHAPHNSPWKTVGPAVFTNRFGKGQAVYLPVSLEDAYMGDFPLPEHRYLLRNIIRQLAPEPKIRVDAPLNIESVITIDEAKRQYIVHLVQFNGVPDAQALSTSTTLIPTMEEAARYSTTIHTDFVTHHASAASAATSIVKRNNSIDLSTNAVHESITISF
jgi:hypothetical protein